MFITTTPLRNALRETTHSKTINHTLKSNQQKNNFSTFKQQSIKPKTTTTPHYPHKKN